MLCAGCGLGRSDGMGEITCAEFAEVSAEIHQPIQGRKEFLRTARVYSSLHDRSTSADPLGLAGDGAILDASNGRRRQYALPMLPIPHRAISHEEIRMLGHRAGSPAMVFVTVCIAQFMAPSCSPRVGVALPSLGRD